MSPVQTVDVRMRRTDPSSPWGFRIHGGADFGTPLMVQKVNNILNIAGFLMERRVRKWLNVSLIRAENCRMMCPIYMLFERKNVN